MTLLLMTLREQSRESHSCEQKGGRHQLSSHNISVTEVKNTLYSLPNNQDIFSTNFLTMKPQALQDAIKAAAAKKKKGWVEPVVKQHKMTKEEYLQTKSPRPFAPEPTAAVAGASNPGLIQQQQNMIQQMLQEQKKAWVKERDQLLAEMKTLRESHAKEISDMREDLQTSTALQRKELKSVRKELADALDAATTSSVSVAAGTAATSHSSLELKEMKQELQVAKGLASTVKSQGKEIESLQKELAALQKSSSTSSKLTQQQVNQKNTDLAATATTSLTTKLHSKSSPKTPKKSTSTRSLSQATKSPKCSLAINLEDHPKTPSKSPRHGKSSSSLPTLKPRFVLLIADAQRKDKALKEFLKTKGASNALGPCTDYSVKHMKVHDCVDANGEMRHLVFFHHRVFVPIKIREEAMEFYYKSNPYGCTTALQQHCIWPKLEEEMTAYKNQVRAAGV